MQYPNYFDLPRPGQVDQRVGETRHDAFAGAGPDTWAKLQIEGGDLLGLGQYGVDRLVGDQLACHFQIVGFDGFDIPQRPRGELKPLFWHGARFGVSRSAPGLPELSGCARP